MGNLKKYVDVYGFKVFSRTKKECIEEIFSAKSPIHVVSGNPEVLYALNENTSLREGIESKNTLIIPDGIGTKIASKLNKNPVVEKIAGIEVMMDIVERCERENKSIFLLGATDESLIACKKTLESKYPNLNICGYANGYFDFDNPKEVLDTIKEANPYAIFVAMGCPKQETFIVNYMNTLPSNIYMGVGGSFDVIGGIKKRAPKLMINLGLEWLYRVYKEPFRIKRLLVIPKFLCKSYFYK